MTNPDDAEIKRILETSRRVAVVGMSRDPAKPAARIPRYLISRGYEVIPVNPTTETILGRKSYPRLQDVPGPLDIVDVFRPPADIPAIVEAVLQRGDVKVLWLQEGIRHDEAAQKAADKGIIVIQDACIYKMHKRLVESVIDSPKASGGG